MLQEKAGNPVLNASNASELVIIPGSKTDKLWYYSYLVSPANDGLNCCSKYTVSFHYVRPAQMYLVSIL
jgi:glycoprotein-N-acetylgalactosamine 3-beta-galactosyltransferase